MRRLWLQQARSIPTPAIVIGSPISLLFDGDSIIANQVPVLSWARRYTANKNVRYSVSNQAHSGSTLQGTDPSFCLAARTATADAINVTTSPSIMVVGVGRNDYATINAGSFVNSSTFVSALQSYCTARKSAGVSKLVVCTVLPSNQSTVQAESWSTWRAAVNTGIRTLTGVDAIIDFAADATMGPDAAASDTNLFYDATHPADAGANNCEAIARAVLNPLY